MESILTQITTNISINLFCLAYLIRFTFYKLYETLWAPLFLLIATSNVCILVQNSQIMGTCLLHHRQGHIVSQLLKTFFRANQCTFDNEQLLFSTRQLSTILNDGLYLRIKQLHETDRQTDRDREGREAGVSPDTTEST